MLSSFFFSNSNFVCKTRISFELRLGTESGRGRFLSVQNGAQWFANQVAQLVVEHFIALTMQRKQYQCIIYWVMHCRTLVEEEEEQVLLVYGSQRLDYTNIHTFINMKY